MANTVAKDLMSAAGINSTEELMKLWAVQNGEMTPEQNYSEVIKGWKGKIKWCDDHFVELTSGLVTNSTRTVNGVKVTAENLTILTNLIGASESDIAEMKAMNTFINGSKKAAKAELTPEELDGIIQEAYDTRVELVEKAKAAKLAKATSSKSKAKAAIVGLSEGNGIDDLLNGLDTI